MQLKWRKEKNWWPEARCSTLHSSSTDLFFLGKWVIGCDWRFFWWLLITQVPKSKCQFLLVRFMRRLMDMNFAKLARDQWPLRAFQVWTVKRICQHLGTRYHFIEDWLILLGLLICGWMKIDKGQKTLYKRRKTPFVSFYVELKKHPGNQFSDTNTTCRKDLGIWLWVAVHQTYTVLVFHHGRKLPGESNCKAFHLATRANTMYRFNARSLGSSHKTHYLASWIPCTFYMIVAFFSSIRKHILR